jgi:type II secretory pathway pseudopilin PulG
LGFGQGARQAFRTVLYYDEIEQYMKLSSKVGLIVIIVVIVAALAGLYTVYSRQAAERRQLNERLERAQVVQSQLSDSKSDLEDQLASAQSSLNASQAQYPASIESIEYGEYIFELIEKCNLQLSSLSFPRPAGRTVGSVTYSVVSLSLPVSGTLENIFKFIDLIRTDPRFASTQVNSVSLNVGGGGATIAVDIYGYKG